MGQYINYDNRSNSSDNIGGNSGNYRAIKGHFQ